MNTVFPMLRSGCFSPVDPRTLVRVFAVFACGIALLLALPAFAQGIRLDADTAQHGQVPLAGQMWALHDPAGELSFGQISSPAYAARFERVPGDFNAGFTSGAWWLRVELDVEADAASGWWLQLDTAATPQVEVWLPRAENAGWQHQLLGRLHPTIEWGLRVPHAPVRLEALPAGRSTAWLRLSGSQPLSLEGELRTEPSALRHLLQGTNLRTATFTIVTMLALVALVIGLAQRDGHFLAFAAHLGVIALSITRDTLFVSVSPVDVRALRLLYEMLPGAGLVTASLMGYRIFEVRAGFPRIAIGLRLLMLFGLLLVLLGALGYGGFASRAARASGLLMDSLFLVLASVRVRRGVPLAVWPLIAYLAGGGGNIAFSLHSFGVVDLGAWVGAGVPLRLTPLVFATAIVTYLGQCTLRSERAARDAQARALAASRAANEKLDASVAERTRELRIENLERRKAERRLKRTLREQRNFLSMVSHEFRTPLSIISASAQLAATDRAIAESRARSEIDKIHRAARRLVNVVDSLLTDDWLDASTMHLRRTDFDLISLLDMLRERHAQVSERRVELRTSEVALYVFADESLLRVLFNNLLDNAVKHSPAGTPVEIDVRRDADCVVVSVHDHGPGIHDEDVERIFERYYRAPSAMKRPGLGLGLHIVYRIAELHEGHVSVANAVGGGARFTLRLPDGDGARTS